MAIYGSCHRRERRKNNSLINYKLSVNQVEMDEDVFDIKFLNHFMLIDGKHAQLYWVKSYSNLK